MPLSSIFLSDGFIFIGEFLTIVGRGRPKKSAKGALKY
jgi:hypothetical protein